ncbi:hypothetical protein AVEN_126774-1 [Araneus ventricosus]|uniref:Uncharacterized protein n=1 Tax=Araneus ventricosus TaxID=182803 RepID=A0A4Y2ILK2_ARAVE|nr:hypothetical protein AVEN_126774-1 [Araneus ventricosus]
MTSKLFTIDKLIEDKLSGGYLSHNEEVVAPSFNPLGTFDSSLAYLSEVTVDESDSSSEFKKQALMFAATQPVVPLHLPTGFEKYRTVQNY